MAALGYDAALILADALKRAGRPSGAKLRDAIAATKDFPGVTGKITIDARRNAVEVGGDRQVKDGKFQFVETIARASRGPDDRAARGKRDDRVPPAARQRPRAGRRSTP